MRNFALCAVAIVLVGCGSSEPAAQPEAPPTVVAEVVGPPASVLRSKLAMLRGGERLYIGDNWDSAIAYIPVPKQSFELSDLPEKFKSPLYRARGWEKGSQSFGVIFFEGRLALGMLQNDRGTTEDLSDLVLKYEGVFGPSKAVAGAKVNYWFWQDGSTRLMICGIKKKDYVKITTALADEVLCQALGISPEAAEVDQVKVDSKLGAAESDAKKK